jgi:spore coat protein U-like protein
VKKLMAIILMWATSQSAFAACSLFDLPSVIGNYNQSTGITTTYNIQRSCDTNNTFSFLYLPNNPPTYSVDVTNGISTASVSISSTNPYGTSFFTPCVNKGSGLAYAAIGPEGYGSWCGTITVPAGLSQLTAGTYVGRLFITYKEVPTSLTWEYINPSIYTDIIMTVVPSCSISTTGINFGIYSSSNGTNSTGTITSNCTLETAYEITIAPNQNNNWSEYYSQGSRVLRDGENKLMYELYKDPSQTLILGDGYSNGTKISLVGTGQDQYTTVYGKIPAGQRPTPGIYSDSLTVTLTY